jgi:hypothetical protein
MAAMDYQQWAPQHSPSSGAFTGGTTGVAGAGVAGQGQGGQGEAWGESDESPGPSEEFRALTDHSLESVQSLQLDEAQEHAAMVRAHRSLAKVCPAAPRDRRPSTSLPTTATARPAPKICEETK